MATNLTTIQVQLQANARNFKQNIDTAGKSLNKLKKSTTSVTQGQEKFQKRLRDVAGSIAAVQGPLGPVAGRLNAIGAITGRVNLATLGLLGSITALSVVFVKFATVGARAESQLNKLEAIVKATGGAAQQTVSDLDQLAISVGRNTLASVQGAREAAGILLTFKSISGEAFGKTLELSQDLAAVGFGSITTAATQLGKALEEPEVGLSALRRVGVSFSEQQKEQIKLLALTGRQAEAQTLILKALEDQVGGAGKGAAKGLSGAFDTLGENITLFFEKATVGKAIVSGLTTVINALANILQKFIPEEQKLAGNLEDANAQLKSQEKLISELVARRKGLSDKNSEFFIKDNRARAKTKKLINEQIIQENEFRKKIQEKIKLLEKEPVVVNKAVDILTKARKKQIMAQEDQIRLSLAFDDVTKQQIQDEIKLRNALIGKLGNTKEALEFIDTLLKANAEGFKNTAEVLTRFNNRLEETDKIATGVANEVTKVGDTIVDAFLRGEQSALNFKNILRELLISIQKTIIQVLILDRVNKAIRTGINKIFAPEAPVSTDVPINVPPKPAAMGGAVQRNAPRLVGERGPELFVPKTAGAITPSSLTPGKIGGGQPVVINQNLNFALGVTNTVRSEIANLLPTIQQSTLSAVSDAKLRGGKFAKAFGG